MKDQLARIASAPMPAAMVYCDMALVGKMEIVNGRLDGFKLKVLINERLELILAEESARTGRSKLEILGEVLDISLT